MSARYRLEERRRDGKLLGVVSFHPDTVTAFRALQRELRRAPYLYVGASAHRLVVKPVTR